MISSRIKYFFIIASMLCVFYVCVSVYYYSTSSQGHIYEFNFVRDAQSILDIFKNNWHELVSGDDYSPEFMMQNRTPDTDSERFGILKIKVMREKNKLAGFVAYYRETPKKGIVLFLAVGHHFRGKRYGQALMECAIKNLLSMGVTHIGLWVLIDNVPARKIYKELGFIEKFEDGENSYFEHCH